VAAGRQTRVADALKAALERMEGGRQVRESLALAYWADVVGEKAAAATEPESVRDGVLFVRTKSSVWSHELTFLSDHIRQELNRRIGRPVIQKIVFRARGLSPRTAPDERCDHPTPQELEALQLPPSAQLALDRKLAKLAGISDEKIRASLVRRVTGDHKLRHWRLARGWKPCRKCGALHNSEGESCPICRVCE